MPSPSAPATAATRMGRPPLRRVGWIAAAVAAAAAAAWALRPQPVEVETAAVTRGPMTVTIDEEGKTRVRNVFIVSAPVTGKLRRSSLDPGDTIVGGDTVIAVIEPTAPAFLDARARHEVEAQINAARAAIALAEAELRQAESELIWAKSELDRSRTLAQSSVVSARAFERARLEHDKQIAAVARAKANLDVRRAELASATARLIGPETSPQPGQAAGETCCVEIRSPQSGQVLRELQESERVVAAGTPLFEIGDTSDIEIVAELLSTDAVRVPIGARARIEASGLPEPLTARVRKIEPAGYTKVSALGIEEQRVRAVLDVVDPPTRRSRLGHDYKVFLRIDIWHNDLALRVPLSALFRHRQSWAVYIEKNGRAALTPIVIGQRTNESAEVVSGLAEGTSVILHPSDRIADAGRIRRIPQAATR